MGKTMHAPTASRPECTPVELLGLNSRTYFIHTLPADTCVRTLRAEAARLLGLPSIELRLKCGTGELHDGMRLSGTGVRHFPVRVALRLLGGKGGFGAMLRASGKGGVKTTNFDACRDLNGRRLRHVNAEVKLSEWEANADERKRKKMEEKARRGEGTKPAPPPRFDDDAYDEMLEATRKAVSESVAAAAASGKTTSSSTAMLSYGEGSSSAHVLKGQVPHSSVPGKRASQEMEEPPTKAAKLWADPLAGLEGSESEESEEGTGTIAST
uniref:SDE2-like domain-containing protein n=1 Tax=Coccolithus braarudii TaxID=221442 RepID=A0A7S0L8D9_9EUKA